ncbi:MAG: CinA family protein [Chloroflexi bacterium]|nr:CinA family protein [Chloroflexota bacterium]
MQRTKGGPGLATLEEQVGELLVKAGLTIATAESTTGGYIGHLLNNVAGSSKYYVGSVVAYHTRPKISVLHVPEEVFKTSGSVSVQCALAMAQGVREVMDVDIGVSETGIAGPSRGTPEKPVGTVFIAISTKDGYELAERHVWDADRAGFKVRTAEAVLELVRHYVSREPTDR